MYIGNVRTNFTPKKMLPGAMAPLVSFKYVLGTYSKLDHNFLAMDLL